jgi:hypothetical protein
MAAVVAGTLSIVVDLIVLSVFGFGQSFGAALASSVLLFRSAVAPLATALLLLGLVGLYARQSEATGVPGLISFLVAFVGSVLAQSFILGDLLANLGWALFGVSCLRARVYPRVASTLLIIGAVVTIGAYDGVHLGHREVMRGAAGTIKRVTLELGGKSANVVFADADLEAAAAAAPLAVFGNAGQDCCARSRILVERSATDEFLSLLEPAVTGLVVGDPADERTQMGPLISAGQRETVASFVPEGTPVAIRGSAPDGPGWWYPPTVLTGVEPGDRAATEEIFGPVAVVLPFDGEAEAVALANASIYGLSGSIWTRDLGRALRVARALETGTLSVNSNTSVRVATPFGGFKQSGVGRELGPHALDHYTELKNVFLAT